MITPQSLDEAANDENTPAHLADILKDAAAEIRRLRSLLGAVSEGPNFRDVYRRRDSRIEEIKSDG